MSLFLLLFAFYESEQLELSGNVRINSGGGRLPAVQNLPDRFFERDLALSGAIARVMANAYFGERVTLEAHVFQLFSGSTASAALGGAADGFAFAEVGRTQLLTWRWHERGNTVAELAVDRLSLRLDLGPVVLTLGRQAVNLATTYFFTPNDFFQQFSAQTFFRVYKPGVDAARAEVQIADLTQLTLVSVLGYARDGPPSADDPVDYTASSLLLRLATTLLDVEWAVLGGKIPGHYVVGGSLQGELFSAIGIRAEGHYGFPEEDDQPARIEIAGGIERRFESSLFLRLEQYYHRTGAADPERYLERDRGIYLGRHYTAFGAGMEVTPLLNMDGLVLFNWTDRSFILSLYAVYSLLDEVEASLVVSVPIGDDPELIDLRSQTLVLGSEYGAYPVTALAELRAYF